MQSRLRTLFAMMAFVAAALILPRMLGNYLMGFDSSMQDSYNQIQVGDQASVAIQLLGLPVSTDPHFPRALSSYESDFPLTERSKCVKFMFWQNGGNWFYGVGVDSNGVIILKADGHS